MHQRQNTILSSARRALGAATAQVRGQWQLLVLDLEKSIPRAVLPQKCA